MNCPVCHQNCQPCPFKTKDNEDSYHCTSNLNEHYFYYNPDVFFNIEIRKYNQKVIELEHRSYPKQEQEFWWIIKTSHRPIDQIISAGCNQLSPEQAYQVLQRHQTLLIFS